MMAGKIRSLVVILLLVAAFALGAPSPAAAAQTCTGTIANITIRDSLVVPAGASCVLLNVVVRGGITIEPGADFSEIRGSVTISGFYVGFLARTTVRGDVTMAGNFGSQLALSTVRGDVTFTDSIGPAFIHGSVIENDLSCSGG